MSRRLRVQRDAGWLLLLVLLTMFVLSACRPQETELPAETTEKTEVAPSRQSQETDLPFETVEQKLKADLGPPYEGREPGLMVIARPEEVANLDDWVTEDAKTQLQMLDYDAHFALAVFQGWKPTDGYSIQVERITRQGDKVTVYVRLQEPQPDREKRDIETSPYHLVQMQKVGAWAGDVTFNVVADGAVITSVTHDIP